jgi:uncharacterized protein YbaP (TraB family)
MRIFFTAAVLTLCSFLSKAQDSKIKPNKYPSLLWEITGKGLSKPSYLFGTMHVSNKMVFHLSDSFYTGIRNADVVALETNPESWQEDMSKYEMNGYGGYAGPMGRPSDYLTINSLKFASYEKLIEAGLHSNPSIINSFLYRSYEHGSDFEEDTYLDLYIYQVGKKWGKKLCGVENFDESMKLMKEAYTDAAKDKSVKRRSFDYDEDFSTSRLQEAYRTGNLDLLDTINQLNSYSAAFDEKFLYKRNEIQANSIDSIIRSGSTLFVGVGAAHLPGYRGVIEMLRRMGYTLRPIKMLERDSRHKEDVEKLRVPVSFEKQSAPDGLFSVSIPGKFYSFLPEGSVVAQQQYADMANGSYYMVTRIQTNAAFWGHNSDAVYRKIDSVLYENIPGKILSKQPITRNGYRGFDISNRTRRGDYQRYNIFITPFEVLVFKMSGNGDYVKEGKEAAQFFSSIGLQGYRKEWKKYAPAAGGFEVEMPHQPVEQKGDNWQFTSYDKETETAYGVLRTDVHNYNFVEEDSFDLNLMEESFASSEFIDKQLGRKHTVHKGYPALDSRYRLKDGSVVLVKYLIRGPHYYTVVTRSKKEHPAMTRFLNSFSITPFAYPQAKMQKDTTLFFTVSSPVPIIKESKLDMGPGSQAFYRRGGDDDEDDFDMGVYEDRVVESDSTGEKVYVAFQKNSKYFYDDDTLQFGDPEHFRNWDEDWQMRSSRVKDLPGNVKLWDYTVGNKNSSRIIRHRMFYQDGAYFILIAQGDTLSAPSAFVNEFFNTFLPFDTVKGVDPYTRKSHVFFSDFFSSDTVLHKKAVKHAAQVRIDSTDFPQLKKAIQSLTWKEKKYLDVKNTLITKLSAIPSQASSDYLKEIYYSAGDTLSLQYRALEALLLQQTDYSFTVFRDILINEPPVLNVNTSGGAPSYPEAPSVVFEGTVDEVDAATTTTTSSFFGNRSYADGSFMDELYDSVQLTAKIFKGILPLISVEDYERPVMNLMARLVDSNLVAAKDYEMYLPKFLIEARQALKKQQISEKSKLIREAQKEDDEDDRTNMYISSYTPSDNGNSMLSLYSRLLMPFYDSNPAVAQLMEQLLRSNDKRLKYNTTLLLLRYNKPAPDSLLKYFAGLDEFRYELYSDLERRNLLRLFPATHNNHIDLARSMLMEKNSYSRPDSVVYLDKLPVQYKGYKGQVYFFKYKRKKDDNSWKIATVGLIPADPRKFTWNALSPAKKRELNFTAVTNTKLSTDEPLREQLNKELKKRLYERRNSAARFYEEDRRGMYHSMFD